MKKFLIVLLVLFPAAVSANGFYLYEFGAYATGQSGSVTAGIDDPSAVFMNPAHVANLSGLRLLAGTTVYLGSNSFKGKSGKESSAKAFSQFTPYLFATYQIHELVGAGIGMFTNYGLSINWPAGWEGNNLVKEAGIETITINPVVSFKVPFLEGLSFGGGLQVVYGKAYLRQGINLVDQWGYSTIGGSKVVYGWNAGLRYRPVKLLSMGIVYRSSMKMSLSDANMAFDVPENLKGMFPDQKAGARVNLPGAVAAGVRLYPADSLQLELDVIYVLWSVYKDLEFTLSRGTPTHRVIIEKNWKDAPEIRFGGEYALKPSWKILFGFIYDITCIPDSTLDPSLPDNNRLDLSIGTTYDFGSFTTGISYMAVIVFDRTIKEGENPLPGTYKALIHNISLSAGYNF
jgi:long-chain fatty acid transport protein